MSSFFTAGYRAGYAVKTPSVEVEEGGCRLRPPSILLLWWVLFEYISIVVLTTSLLKSQVSLRWLTIVFWSERRP